VQYESEHVVLDVEPARGVRLQHERLAKGLRRVVVSFYSDDVLILSE